MEPITIHNYEMFFALYWDNELSPADKAAVEAFVQAHPDLQFEWEAWQQSILPIDDSINFAHKADLFRSESIALHNYEEWFTLYFDNELTTADKNAVEDFVVAHPQVQNDFQLAQKSILPTDTIVFANKGLLYRHEKGMVRRFDYRRLSAAAAIFVALLGGYFFIQNQSTSDISIVPLANNESVVSTIEPSAVQNAATTNSNEAAVVNLPATNTTEERTLNATNTSINTTPQLAVVHTTNTSTQESTVETRKPLTNFAVEKLNTLESNTETAKELLAAQPKNLSAENNFKKAVTESNANSYNLMSPQFASNISNEDGYADGDNKSSKKGKLRGFIRKVERNFEKRFIASGDEEDDKRLLVGGLAIKY